MTETATPLSDLPGPAASEPAAPEPQAPPAPPPAPPQSSPSSGETDRLDPEPTVLVLESGVKIRVLPLKMRQLFRLLRIITRGGAQYLPMLREALMGMTGSVDEADAAAFGTQLVAVAIIALPEAEDEAIDFIMSVTEPHDLRPGRDKATTSHNDKLRTELQEALFNPEMEDMISIVEKVIELEKDDLLALGKRLGQTFKLAQKVDPEASPTSQPG